MLGILCACFDDVELHGVSSNSPHNSIFLAASIFGTAVDILDPVANGIA